MWERENSTENGDEGATAKFVGYGEMEPLKRILFSLDYTDQLVEQPGNGSNLFHQLKQTTIFNDMVGRLNIE